MLKRSLPLILLLSLACDPQSIPSNSGLDTGATTGSDRDAGDQTPSDAGQVVIVPDTGPQPDGCEDGDGDGYGLGVDCLGSDCDDNNPWLHPGIVANRPFCSVDDDPNCGLSDLPFCDGIDNNCDGVVVGLPMPRWRGGKLLRRASSDPRQRLVYRWFQDL